MRQDEAARLRREYEAGGLIESEMASDPFDQFREWFDGVVEVELFEPNTFVLATADPSGRPSARAVLMKSFSADGIVFYTNMSSRKSRELKQNPMGAATFVWLPLHRQVRFEGPLTPVDDSIADEYFASRPRGAQIGAHASPQSEVVESRDFLERRYTELEESFGEEVPRPDTWGGWCLRPRSVEFWQGLPNRFHDRILYRLEGDAWSMERLAP